MILCIYWFWIIVPFLCFEGYVGEAYVGQAHVSIIVGQAHMKFYLVGEAHMQMCQLKTSSNAVEN